MKIKKPMTIKAPASGGAAIADRFKLEEPSESKTKSPGGKSVAFAFSASLIALGVAGFLVYLLYQRWEFLMPK